MHDQKFEKKFRPRPEDGLYGLNETKKCEIRPVVSSIVHFKVFKSYFIYIGLENFEMHDWGNYRADFAFFGLIRTVQSVFRSWPKKIFQIFGRASI